MAQDNLKVRIPPHSEESEQCVLGCMILDKEALVTAQMSLKADDFYNDNNKLVFNAISDMRAMGFTVDAVTLLSRLTANGDIEKIGGASYIIQLENIVPSTKNIEEYCRIVREKATLREMIIGLSGVVSDCYDDVRPLSDIVETAEKLIYDVSLQRAKSEFVSLREEIKPAIVQIGERFERGEGFTGVPTGFTELDGITNGLQPSDMILIAARPSMGKTALGLNIATNASLRSGKSVAFFSLEMSAEQLVLRIISSEAEVDSKKLRTGANLTGDWKKLVVLNTRMDEAKVKLFIDDTSSISVGEMRSKLRKLAAKEGLDMVVIDYLQLLTTNSVSKNENRQNYVSQISRELKALAKELKIPVVALSQLNRSPEARSKEDKRPVLSDLRDSGAIEQDADIVMMLYRSAYYDKTTDPTETEVIIAKHRNGETGTVKLTFLPQFTKFVNLITTYEQQ